MKRPFMLILAIIILLVASSGCFWPYYDEEGHGGHGGHEHGEGGGRGGGGHGGGHDEHH